VTRYVHNTCHVLLRHESDSFSNLIAQQSRLSRLSRSRITDQRVYISNEKKSQVAPAGDMNGEGCRSGDGGCRNHTIATVQEMRCERCLRARGVIKTRVRIDGVVVVSKISGRNGVQGRNKEKTCPSQKSGRGGLPRFCIQYLGSSCGKSKTMCFDKN
jgi:hypothetical protein